MINPTFPQGPKLLSWVLRLFDRWVRLEWTPSSPTQLSVGGDPLDQNPARGNKRVLTSTLLSPADDSFRLMIAMLIQIGEFSPLLRRSVFKCGGWVLVVGDYKIPPECHRHVPIHHLEMTLG